MFRANHTVVENIPGDIIKGDLHKPPPVGVLALAVVPDRRLKTIIEDHLQGRLCIFATDFLKHFSAGSPPAGGEGRGGGAGVGVGATSLG
jgi:hypothetical protein